jgi:hypothetical protein
VSYWKLDEASGTRVDVHGTNHLTDNNAVTQGVGKVGNAAQFVSANAQYLSCPDSTDLKMNGTAFTMAFWVNHSVVGLGIQTYFSKSHTLDEYMCWMNTNVLQFVVFTTTPTQIICGINTALVVGVWYFIVVSYDLVTLNVRLNDSASATPAACPNVRNFTSPFRLGRYDNLTTRNLNGRLDEFGIWRRILTSTEQSYLYNAGAGRTYPLA